MNITEIIPIDINELMSKIDNKNLYVIKLKNNVKQTLIDLSKVVTDNQIYNNIDMKIYFIDGKSLNKFIYKNAPKSIKKSPIQNKTIYLIINTEQIIVERFKDVKRLTLCNKWINNLIVNITKIANKKELDSIITQLKRIYKDTPIYSYIEY